MDGTALDRILGNRRPLRESNRLNTDLPAEDADLVRRALDDDREAFGELVRRYQNRIFAAIYRILGNREDAREFAQETFLRAFAKLSTFREGARFSTWLYTIALNLTRSELRKRKVRKDVKPLSLDAAPPGEEARPAEPKDVTESPAETVGRRELYRLALREIGEMEPDMREVVVLRDMQDLSYEEIAGAIGCPVGTVRSRLFRARRLLRDRLSPMVDGRRAGGAA